MVGGQSSVQDTGKMNFPRITGPGKDEVDFSRGTGCWKGEPILFGFVGFNAACQKQVQSSGLRLVIEVSHQDIGQRQRVQIFGQLLGLPIPKGVILDPIEMEVDHHDFVLVGESDLTGQSDSRFIPRWQANLLDFCDGIFGV